MDRNDPEFPLMTSYPSQPTTYASANGEHRHALAVDAHPRQQNYTYSARLAPSMPPLGSRQEEYTYSSSQADNPGVLASQQLQPEIDPYLYGPSGQYATSLPPRQQYQYPSTYPPPPVDYTQYSSNRKLPSDPIDLPGPPEAGIPGSSSISHPSLQSPDFMGSLRTYHQEQTRQHARALHHLTRAHERQVPDSGLGPAENAAPFSQSFVIQAAPSTALDLAGDHNYQQQPVAASSIPMSNFDRHLNHRQDMQLRPSDSQPYHLSGQIQFPQRDYGQRPQYQQQEVIGTHGQATIGVGASFHPNPITSFQALGTGSAPDPSASPAPFSVLDVLRPGVLSNTSRDDPRRPKTTFGSIQPTSNANVEDTLISRTSSAASSKDFRRERIADKPFEADQRKVSRREGIGDVMEGSRSSSVLSTVSRGKRREDTSARTATSLRKTPSSVDSSSRTTPVEAEAEGQGTPELTQTGKKKKKSKMHECNVCQKKFPRPSGLRTHMNTHNNERPFACGFPGCLRTFGVRSNAKRHLRTHGVIPQQSSGTPPYIVDFSTPVVLQDDNSTLAEGAMDNDDGSGNGGTSSQTSASRGGRGKGRQFKLRWMPTSSATRSTAKSQGRQKARDSSSDDSRQMPGQDTERGDSGDEEDLDAEADLDEEDMAVDEDDEIDEADEEGRPGSGESTDNLPPTIHQSAIFATGQSNIRSTSSSMRPSSSAPVVPTTLMPLASGSLNHLSMMSTSTSPSPSAASVSPSNWQEGTESSSFTRATSHARHHTSQSGTK